MQQKDVWLQIPPEEKFALMAKANSTGLFYSLCVLGLVFAIAIGLKIQWFVWGGLVITPLVFQFAAGKAWRMDRPILILSYLAARSVARRFAYATKAQDLSLQLIFRGEATQVFEDQEDSLSAAFEAIEKATIRQQHWIALLNGAVVVFTEGRIGAELTCVANIDDKLIVSARNRDGSDDEYSPNREVEITIGAGGLLEKKFILSSPFPAALNAFEKKLVALKEHNLKLLAAQAEVKRAMQGDVDY